MNRMLRFLTRPVERLTAVQAMLIRRTLSSAAGKSGVQKGGHGGHEPNPELWRKIFLFVACPAMVISMINTYMAETEHWEHYRRPKFVPYEYMRIRTHPFPWGDGNHSLFHNPLVNPLPNGWEPLPDHLKKYDVPDDDEEVHGHH